MASRHWVLRRQRGDGRFLVDPPVLFSQTVNSPLPPLAL